MADYNQYTTLLDLSSVAQLAMQHGKLQHYRKGDYFNILGSNPKYMGYVVKGALRYTCTHTDGTSSIVGYASHEGFVGDYPSFQNRIPSTVDIEALCDCEVYIITYAQLNTFYNSTPENRFLAQRIAEVLLLEVYQRMLALYSQTPEERYLDIIQRVPELLTVITLKELASYLRITPETLSRIRKKLVGK